MEPYKKIIDIVIPCYNEEPNILSLVTEIDRIMTNCKYRYKLIFVDDGSNDNTYLKIQNLKKTRENIYLVKLSRNFGKEAAIAAGLRKCSSDAAIVIDSDLQHPPRFPPSGSDCK